MLTPSEEPDDPRVFPRVLGLMNKTAYALQHVSDAQDSVRVLCTAAVDSSAMPWPTLLAKLTAASNFIESLRQDLDESSAETAIAVCPTRLCADPSVCTCMFAFALHVPCAWCLCFVEKPMLPHFCGLSCIFCVQRTFAGSNPPDGTRVGLAAPCCC